MCQTNKPLQRKFHNSAHVFGKTTQNCVLCFTQGCRVDITLHFISMETKGPRYKEYGNLNAFSILSR